MGTRRTKPLPRSSLADALFTNVQQRVLGLLFGQPARRFQSAELIRLAASGTGAAHRCVTAFANAGLVTVTRIGNQKHYQANAESPVFSELRGLVVRTVGLADPVRAALTPLTDRIDEAFIYGSVAKGTESAGSDVDLMVISDGLGYPEIFEALQPVERALARKVNPTVMSRASWAKKLRVKDSFVTRVAKGERIDVIRTAGDGS